MEGGYVYFLPKHTKSAFNEVNSKPISILLVLRKIMEKVLLAQIQGYFLSHKLIELAILLPLP